MRDMTKAEARIVEALGQCYVDLLALPELHRSDAPEFATAIHACQNIVYARPAYEAMLPAVCGRLLVGRGSDTYDPLCQRPYEHDGICE